MHCGGRLHTKNPGLCIGPGLAWRFTSVILALPCRRGVSDMRIPTAMQGPELRAFLDDVEARLSSNQQQLDKLGVDARQTHDRMMRCYDALAQLRAKLEPASNSAGGVEPKE